MALSIGKLLLQLAVGGNGSYRFAGGGVGKLHGIAGQPLCLAGKVGLRQLAAKGRPYPHGKEILTGIPFLRRQGIQAEGRPQIQERTILLI